MLTDDLSHFPSIIQYLPHPPPIVGSNCLNVSQALNVTYTLHGITYPVPSEFVTTEMRVSNEDIEGKDILPLLGAYVLKIKLKNESGIPWSAIKAAGEDGIEINMKMTTSNPACSSFRSFFNTSDPQYPFQFAFFTSDERCCTAGGPDTATSNAVCIYTKPQGAFSFHVLSRSKLVNLCTCTDILEYP
jgi:hypothetical protein